MKYWCDDRPQADQNLRVISDPLLALLSSFQTARTKAQPDLVAVEDFNLGDSILSFQPAGTPETICSELYLIKRGAVRLLCQNPAYSRQVSAVLLQAGDSFGVSCFFCSYPLPYRAIAASSCQIARVPVQKLLTLMQQMPYLQKCLARQEQQRDQLLFFKSLTSLSFASSEQLQRILLPYLVQQQVRAGSPLSPVASQRSGHFWLRSGAIVSQTDFVPRVGEDWGYFGRTPTDWIAQTDLVIYKLPIEHLEAARIFYR